MTETILSAARAVAYPFPTPEEALAARRDCAVTHYGFYCPVDLSSEEDSPCESVVIRLTGRSMYRLYVNGDVVMHGPARTAHGYCRVDELDITDRLIDGVNHVAVELMVYGDLCEAYHQYSNDSTLETGLFAAEILADGEVLAATGTDTYASAWQVTRLSFRHPRSERISHSRESTEIYTLEDEYYLWRLGLGDFTTPAPVEEPLYLPHEALFPTLREYPFTDLCSFGPCRIDPDLEVPPHFFEVNSAYFDSLPEHPTLDCRRTVEATHGQVRVERSDDGITLLPAHTEDFSALFEAGESRVGFVRIAVTCERAGVIDLVPTELLDLDGTVPYYFNSVIRLHVPAGLTEFVSMEPALARYLLAHFRGTGAVTVHALSLLDDAYPDEHRASFLCSDDNINRLYGAAKKTLLLNTLDIFMDCPERERGGWLCDSLWTGRAASLLLGDHRVEREYLENFLLTPAEGMAHAFFPEVYPAHKENYPDFTGITTWSFWLMCEVCEFIRRTGDILFRDTYKPRVAAFVEGSAHYLGASGLLENMPFVFVDWSLSNNQEYNQPVSTAANALYAYTLTELGRTFGEPAWVTRGEELRDRLRAAVLHGRSPAALRQIPDSFTVEEGGRLRSRGLTSESGTATSLWCGLFSPEEAPALYCAVRDRMGPAPRFAKDPMVGGSQLFIGLCIRLDMLCRGGAYDKMFEDMKAIFEPQLKEGPGTLWEVESIDASSRCHGFASHAGVHLLRDVVGLSEPLYGEDGEGDPTLRVSPHLCGLRWAKGTLETPEGVVAVSWRYDGESFTLRVEAPADFAVDVILPREVSMLDPHRVSVVTNHY